MKRLILGCLSVVFAVSLASEAFGWGAVRGPAGGGAYRGPMGGEAVRGPAGNTAVRGPAGGAAAWGHGGARCIGRRRGESITAAPLGHTIQAPRSRRAWPSARLPAPRRRRPTGRPPIMHRRSWSLRLPAATILIPPVTRFVARKACPRIGNIGGTDFADDVGASSRRRS